MRILYTPTLPMAKMTKHGCEARDHVLQTSLTNKPHFELPQALRASHFPISSTAQLTTEEQDKLPPSRVCHSVLRSALQTPQSRRQTSKDVIHHMKTVQYKYSLADPRQVS